MSGTIESPGAGPIKRLRAGVMLFVEGFGFLRRERRLWALAGVPVLFAVVGVAGAVAVFSTHLGQVHRFWSASFPALEATEWWTWIWIGPGLGLFWVLGWLAVVVSFAIALVAALLLANLASAPFLDRLSQRVEEIVLGRPISESSSTGSFLSDVLRSFAGELARLSFLGGIGLVLTLAGFVAPGAHIVTAPLLLVITILFLPLDYAGFALDRRGLSFRARRRWLWSELPTMLGFGGVAFAACLVPGLNLVILPALVTAGTLLVVRAQPAEITPG